MGHLTGEYSETEFNDYSRSAERTPLKEGMFTETKTGKPISKLMGNFKDYDCGYTSVGTSPFNSLLMCNDFATLFTFISVLTFWLASWNSSNVSSPILPSLTSLMFSNKSFCWSNICSHFVL